MFDSLTSATYVAAVTRTLRVGSYVCLLPLREPVASAQAVATLDHLSNGRFTFGVGLGWATEEYQAVGVPWEERGRRATDYLLAMKALWNPESEVSTYNGEFVAFDGIMAYPKPVQAPHPPIIVGGTSQAALRRTAEVGDGWVGYGMDVASLNSTRDQLQAHWESAGRSGRPVFMCGHRTAGPTIEGWQRDADYAGACRQVGLDQLVLSPRLAPQTFEADLTRYAEAVGVGAY